MAIGCWFHNLFLFSFSSSQSNAAVDSTTSVQETVPFRSVCTKATTEACGRSLSPIYTGLTGCECSDDGIFTKLL